MSLSAIRTIVLTLPVLCPVLAALQDEAARASREPLREERAPAEPVRDQPLEQYQRDLLDVAFRAASAFPLQPHIKNRSRAQEKVVVACFELDQPIQALACIGKIENWRRGVGFADFAHYCAERGDTAEVRKYLDLALEVAGGEDPELEQEWRRDRIRAKVARALYLLGEDEQAAGLIADLVDSEQGLVMAARASQATPEVFDDQVENLDATYADFSTLGLDQVRNVLATITELYERFFPDAERRARLEEKIEAIPWDMVPPGVQIEFLAGLAEVVLGHGEESRALELVKEAHVARKATRWAPEDEIPLAARLAALRFRAGDPLRAKGELDAARALFDAQRESIASMFRGAALRPLAAAYKEIGDERTALSIYAIAIADGAENPNARPRAEDLSETCTSMALHGVQPDEQLWTRIRTIQAGLRDPW